MITADWIAIGVAVFAVLAGYVMGFGKTFDFLTKGTIGLIISLVICWFLFGIVLNWGFVQELVQKMVNYFQSADKWYFDLLLKIRIDLIAVGIALLIVVQIIRAILNKFIENVFESDNALIVVLNKSLGIIIMVAFFAVLALIVFQIFDLVGSNAIIEKLTDSKLKLDYIYNNNPLKGFMDALAEANPLK